MTLEINIFCLIFLLCYTAFQFFKVGVRHGRRSQRPKNDAGWEADFKARRDESRARIEKARRRIDERII